MDRLSQKINTQEVIEANFMAEMAEKEQLKKQLQEYEAILEGMRELYAKKDIDQEAAADLTKKLQEGIDSLKARIHRLKVKMSQENAELNVQTQAVSKKATCAMIAGILAVLLSLGNLAVTLLIHYELF